MFFPSDHLRLLVEFLKQGESELGRRWLAVLMLVPDEERAALVDEMERRATALYAPVNPIVPGKRRAKPLNADADGAVHVVYPATESDGRVERQEVVYCTPRSDAKKPTGSKSASRGRSA